MPTTPFGRKATVRNARMRALFAGPSKSGKSFLALVTATNLLDTLREKKAPIKGHGDKHGRIIVIDTEAGRAEENYGDMFDFDVHELNDFSPDGYIDTLNRAVNAGYSCVIIDQISNEWAGKGGLLEQSTAIQNASSSKNSFTSWMSLTPKHAKFTDAISTCPVHIICTVRSKTDYVLEQTDKGMVPRKVGLAPIQRNETEYEFDIYGQITQKHVVTIETRGSLSRFLGDREFQPGRSVDDAGEAGLIGKLTAEWISGRSDAEASGYASRDQINEIRQLGDEVPVKW